ncbi:hypothetical protein F5890DRAFT_1494428 [Lentinula detonsa]|uniref:Uncharacterized protein n=1 Tax=Lentinula detonsa TaxID=2804962 RepID=A0AA38Q5K2_9AGAR|nr:hypothetical protein F5890DRAFT_1494428 [Lentinula detonsa]
MYFVSGTLIVISSIILSLPPRPLTAYLKINFLGSYNVILFTFQLSLSRTQFLMKPLQVAVGSVTNRLSTHCYVLKYFLVRHQPPIGYRSSHGDRTKDLCSCVIILGLKRQNTNFMEIISRPSRLGSCYDTRNT